MDITANDKLENNEEPNIDVRKQVYEWVGMEKTPESNFSYDNANDSSVRSAEHEIKTFNKETSQTSVSHGSNNRKSINSQTTRTRIKLETNTAFDTPQNDARHGSTVVLQKRAPCQFSVGETHDKSLKRNSLKAKSTSAEKGPSHEERTHDPLTSLESDTRRSEMIPINNVRLRVSNNQKSNTDNINIIEEKAMFTCDKCKKTYTSKTALAKHTKYYTAEMRILCKICGDAFDAQDRLTAHLKKHKGSEFQCEVCSKNFTDQAKLNSHLRVHGKGPPIKMDKQFLCDVCSKTFASRTGLGFHLRTHTGYKPYTCQYCSKGFTISSNKIRHERTHTGDKHFVCHICSTAFSSSNGLKYHLTIHTGETNYHCKTCGKSFTRLKYLKEHNFTHTGEKPFKCKICSASYGNSGSLFAHEKKCKAQYSTCLIESNKCSAKESQYIQNHGSNGILYSKIHGQPQHELQFPYSQEIPPISYLLPPQNPSPPDIQYQTSHHLVSAIRPAAVSAGTWQCFKWSDAT